MVKVTEQRTQRQTCTWIDNRFSTNAPKPCNRQSEISSISGVGTMLFSWTPKQTSPSGPHVIHRNLFGMHYGYKHKRKNYKSSENNINEYLHNRGEQMFCRQITWAITTEELSDKLVVIKVFKSLPKDIIKKMKRRVHSGDECSQNKYLKEQIYLKEQWHPACTKVSYNSITKLQAAR